MTSSRRPVSKSAARTGAVAAPRRGLRIKAPTLALGYWNRPDADAEILSRRHVLSGRLVRCARGGVYRFAGREDSLVKIHGRWVDLSELEQRLANVCPGIVEAAAASVPDGDGVDAVAFFYVVKAGAPADAESLLRAHMNTLPHYRRPRWLHAVASLPRTATGKLLRRELKVLHRTLDLPDIGPGEGEA